MTAVVVVLIICGSVLMAIGMLLGYFRWFYARTEEGARRRYWG